jgi:hypothetical protein
MSQPEARKLALAAAAALALAGPANASDSLVTWQGEWGAWAPGADGRLRGGSLSIHGCNSDGTSCRLRFDVEQGGTRCTAGGEKGLEVWPDAEGRGPRHLRGPRG